MYSTINCVSAPNIVFVDKYVRFKCSLHNAKVEYKIHVSYIHGSSTLLNKTCFELRENWVNLILIVPLNPQTTKTWIKKQPLTTCWHFKNLNLVVWGKIIRQQNSVLLSTMSGCNAQKWNLSFKLQEKVSFYLLRVFFFF